MKHRGLFGVAMLALLALSAIGGGTATGGGNSCVVAPVLRDSAVDQGVGGTTAAGYSPLVRGKDTLVRFYLSNPSCSTQQLQIVDASLTSTVTNADGTTQPAAGPFVPVNPLVRDGSSNYPVISPYSTGPVAADTTSDPRFAVPGYNLVAKDPNTFRAAFSLTGHFRVGATGASTQFGPLSATASFDKQTRALRVLVVKMGDPNGVGTATSCPVGATCTSYPDTSTTTTGVSAGATTVPVASSANFPDVLNLAANGTRFSCTGRTTTPTPAFTGCTGTPAIPAGGTVTPASPAQHPEFGDAAVSTFQNAMSALSRVAPVPGASAAGLSPIGDLASANGGLRYSFNVSGVCGTTSITCGMLNLAAINDANGASLLSPTQKFCGTSGNFTLIQPQLTSMLNAWNAANPNATADRVVGVVDSSISNGTSAACAGGMAAFGSPQAWVRVDPGASNTGAILSMELGHTLGVVPAARSRTGSTYHSKFTEADNYLNSSNVLTDSQRAYNVTSRSYESTDRTATYAADSNWTTDNVVFEAPDFAVLRCQLGGTTTTDCPTAGTVGTGAGVAQGPHFSIAGSVMPDGSYFAVTESFFADNSRYPTPDPLAMSDYRLVQRHGSTILHNDPLPVACDTSDHDSDSPGGGLGGTIDQTACFFATSLDDYDTNTTQIEVWHGAPPVSPCAAAGVGPCLYVRHVHSQPTTTITSTPALGSLKNYTNSSASNETQAAISADGNWVALRRNVDTTGRIQVGPRTKNSFTGLPYPDLTQLLFTSDRSGTPQVFSMHADGSGVTQLTSPPTGWSFEPRFSPDATKFAFSTDRNGNWEIYTASADGTNQTDLTNTLGRDEKGPSWSPDGTKIVYGSADVSAVSTNKCSDIYYTNADGSGSPTQVTSTAGLNEYNPVFSPDGTKIAYVAVPCGDPSSGNNTGTGDVFIYDTVAQTTAHLTFQDDTDDEYPDWSKDGTKLVFERYAGGAYQIHTINADGTGLTKLTTDGVNEQPEWSGSTIYFNSTRDGSNFKQLYSMNADGTGQTPITTHSSNNFDPDPSPVPAPTPDQSYPAWNPDHTALAYVVGDNLYRTTVLTLGGANGSTFTAPTLLFESTDGSVAHPSWSRDGTQIAFAIGSSLWTMNADGSNADQILGDASDPSWSQTPGDNRIAYTHTSFCGLDCTAEDVYLVDPANPNPINTATFLHAGSQPSWGPNGEIAYNSLGAIHLIHSDGSGDTQEVGNVPGGSEPSLVANGLAFTSTPLGGILNDIFIDSFGGTQITVHATPTDDLDPSLLKVDLYYTCNGINYPVSRLDATVDTGAATFQARLGDGFNCAGGTVSMYLNDGLDRWNITPTGGDAIPIVGADGPPIATINTPLDHAKFLQFSGIPLQGVAKSTAGELAGTKLDWKITDPNAVVTDVGTGSSIDLPNAQLPLPAGGWVPGEYTVTLTATDAHGSDTKTAHFTIGADVNNDGLPDKNPDGQPACYGTDAGAAFTDFDLDGIPNIEDPHPCDGPPDKSDTQNPTITVTHTSGVNGQNANQPVTVTVTATDPPQGTPPVAGGLRGINCTLDGGPVFIPGADTVWGQTSFSGTFTVSGYGKHAISCTATDASYNPASASDSVWIVYTFVGFLPPVNNPPTLNTGAAGKTYPVKWQLKDSDGKFVGDLSTVVDSKGNLSQTLYLKPADCGSFGTAATDPLETTATGGTALRYDSASSTYIYNDQATKKGCSVLYLYLNDGTVHTANFQLK